MDDVCASRVMYGPVCVMYGSVGLCMGNGDIWACGMMYGLVG